jgi:glycine oxidase
LNQSEFPDLKTAAGRWRVEGVRFEQLDQKELSSFEPALSPETLLAYFLPDRAQIRNPWHLRALNAACGNLGVTLLPDTPVLGFRRNDERILAVRTAVAEFQPGLVVMAAGAWSGGLLKTANLHVPTPPLKGQLVLFEHEKTLLRRIIEHGKMYLVPRGDGRILMGATEEDTGFDNTPNPNAENQLITHALKICPALKTANVQRTWSGLRPGSLDTRPYLGHSANCRNLLIATGHKRAGLQLAPATAEVIANLVTGEPAGIELKDFAPDRPQPGR